MIKKLILVLGFISQLAYAEDEDFSKLLDDGKPSALSKSADTVHIGTGGAAYLIREIIGKTNAEQNIFISFLAENKFDKALYSWWDAFDGTSFASSDNGRALYGYLLFKNGLEVVGTEKLLTVGNPRALNSTLITWWKQIAPLQHNVWSLVDTKLDPAWDATFGVRREAVIQKQWKSIINQAVNDQTDVAAKSLNQLTKVNGNILGEDLMNITAARMLYQKGFLDPAIRYYQKVSKKSEHYFEAMEEAAWAYLRKGEPQNAMALTRSFMQPELAAIVGPEAVFLHSLGHLKVCDYPEVAKTLTYFKNNYRGRAEALSKIAKGQLTASTESFVSNAKAKSITFGDLGKAQQELPRFITRDLDLKRSLKIWNALEKESKIAGQIYAASLTGGSSRVGFQARYEVFKKSVEAREQAARSASLNQIKDLAATEVKEISDILQKLHIVEAELIQQLSMTERVIQATKAQKADVKVGKAPANVQDPLTFPYEGEVWFDELTNYKVDVKKGCQARKM